MVAIYLMTLLAQVGPNPSLPAFPDPGAERPAPTRADSRDSSRDGEMPLESAWLSRCLATLESDPARAHAQAQIERERERGTARVLANYCLGLAASALERWEDARIALLAAHDETPADQPALRARLAAMAGNAALAAGEAQAALALLDTAGREAQAAGNADIEALAAIDAARALVALGREEDAASRLERARQLRPASSEAWLLWATLARRMGRLDEARQAIAMAAELASATGTSDVQVELEAGVIAMLSGNEAEARAHWQAAAGDEGEAGRAARAYLDQLGASSAAPREAGTGEQG